MLTRQDILTVDVTDEMVARAVAYAEKSLHFTFNRMRVADPYARVRNIITGLVMEEAFKNFLDQHHVRYDLLGATHWTKIDRYDLRVRGHRCDVKGFFARDAQSVRAIERDRAWLLDCCALVPADQIAASSLKEDDWYIFPFMTARPPQNKYLLHTFQPPDESRKITAAVQLLSRMRDPIRVRVGGQHGAGELAIEEIALAPQHSARTQRSFSHLLFLQTQDAPSGELMVTREQNETHTIGVNDWANVWVEGARVYLTGYMSKREFRAKSRPIAKGYRYCKQYAMTKTDNRMLMIKELHPLRELFAEN